MDVMQNAGMSPPRKRNRLNGTGLEPEPQRQGRSDNFLAIEEADSKQDYIICGLDAHPVPDLHPPAKYMEQNGWPIFLQVRAILAGHSTNRSWTYAGSVQWSACAEFRAQGDTRLWDVLVRAGFRTSKIHHNPRSSN